MEMSTDGAVNTVKLEPMRKVDVDVRFHIGSKRLESTIRSSVLIVTLVLYVRLRLLIVKLKMNTT